MGKLWRFLASLIVLLFVATYSPCALAEDPIKIYRIGGPELATADVLAGKYRAQEVASKVQAFTPSPMNSGWWRVELTRDIRSINSPILYLSAMSYTESKIWLPGKIDAFSVSQLNRKANKGFSPRFLVAALSPELQKGESIYWHVVSEEISPLRVGLKPELDLRLQDAETSRWHNIIEGTILALVLAGFVLSLMMREFTFLILAVGTFLSLLFVLASNGDIYYIPALAQFDINFGLQRILGLMACLVMSYFTYIFLDMPRNAPRIAFIQKMIMAIFMALLLASLFPEHIHGWTIANLGNLTIISGTITGIYCSIRLIKAGNRLGKLFLISWAPLFFFSIWRVTEITLKLPFNDFVSVAFPASYVLAGILLYLGLGERILLYKHERDVNEQLARMDSLTDVYNRRALDERLRVAALHNEKTGKKMAVLFVDIDFFKRINDTYGHAIGDAVLREVTVRIRATLRFGDVLGRYGGEEFIIALPDCSETQAMQLAERIRVSIASTPVQCGTQPITVTVSIGVSLLSDGLAGVDGAIQRADQALYVCKQNGRNQVSLTAA